MRTAARRAGAASTVGVLLYAGLAGVAQPRQGPVVAQAAPTCPTVVAHAAGGTYAPENTVAGILASPTTMVEMDVRWSVSGYPVLMHDPSVQRTTDGTGNVADTGLVALTKLYAQDYAPWKTNPAYADVRVPYAWDFVNASAANDMDMLLDVKVTPTEFGARKLIEYVDRFDYRDRLIYMSSPASVTAMRQWFPDLTYLIIEYPPAGMIRTGESLRSLGVDGYAVPYTRITPEAVAYWKSYRDPSNTRPLKVFTWTSDDDDQDVAANWQAMSTAGVDALITDRPADALAWQAPLCGTR